MPKEFTLDLPEGMAELGVFCKPDVLSNLTKFQALLLKWNQTYNLTAIREPKKIISHHLLDSLSVSSYIKGGRVLDIGTGAGLPGIPLSMLHPDKNFVLLDSNAKKTRFVRQAMLELGLTNVEVVRERVERFKNERLFDTIVTRAFSSIAGILSVAADLIEDDGQLLAMRGRIPETENKFPGFRTKVIPIQVPGVNGERHILMMKPKNWKR